MPVLSTGRFFNSTDSEVEPGFLPARYWRILVTSTHGATGTEWYEVEFLAGGADQASGGTAAASSEWPGLVASRAFDNNNTTQWASDFTGMPQWIRYDFVTPKLIDEISISVGVNLNRAPNVFTVQQSDDASTWIDVATFDTEIGDWTLSVPEYFPLMLPAQIDSSVWSVTNLGTGGDIMITLPSSSNNYEYSIDGGAWTALTLSDDAGRYYLSGLTDDVEIGISVRVSNSLGASPGSTEKLVTPTTEAEVADWYSLVYKTVNQAEAGGFNIQSYAGEVTDLAGAHKSRTAPTLLTVPAAWNGRYGKVSGNLWGDGNTHYVRTYKEAAGFVGMVTSFNQGGGRGDLSFSTAILPLATGDDFTIGAQGNGTYWAGDDSCWAQIEILPSDFNGCLAMRTTSSQAFPADTDTALECNGETYDLDGWHDNTTNPSRMTVPVGVSLVRVSANFETDQHSGPMIMFMRRNNGASEYGFPNYKVDTGTLEQGNMVSAPLAATAGDYFEVKIFHDFAGNFLATNGTWFQIEELPSDLKYAIVRRSTDQAVTANVTTAVQWDTEFVDTGGWFDIGNPTRLTVPSGVNYVKLHGNILHEVNLCELTFTKNGSSFIGKGESFTYRPSAHSAIIQVEPGDYFEMTVKSATGFNVSSDARNWFSIEEVRAA